MKTSTKFAFQSAAIMLLLTCCVLLCTQAAYCNGPNLVQNPNMGTGSPANWGFVNSGNATGTWATNTVYTGDTHSLEIAMSATGEGQWYQDITGVNTCVTYNLSGYLYATNVASGSHELIVEWYNGSTFLGINSVEATTANTWQQVSISNIAPPVGSTDAWVELVGLQAGSYWMDNVSLQESSTALQSSIGQPNLLVDSNIETNPSGSWTFVNSGNATGTWATNEYVSGTHSFEIAMSAAGEGQWYQNVTGIDTTVKYRLRAHVYATNVASGSEELIVEWFNSGGAQIGINRVSATTANVWQELELLNLTPPAGTTTASVELVGLAAGTYWADDFVFQRQDVNVLTLGDGKFPMNLICAWGSLPENNLVFNGGANTFPCWFGDFVYGTGTSPEGWVSGSPGGGGTAIWDGVGSDACPADVEFSKNFFLWNESLQVKMTTSGEVYWSQYIPYIDPTQTYILSAEIDATNVASGSHSVVVDWYNGGTCLGGSPIASTTANVWTLCTSAALTPPAGANCAYVDCCGCKAGTYNFDCISLALNRTAAACYTEALNAGFNSCEPLSSNLLGMSATQADLANMATAGMTGAYLFTSGDEYVPNPPSPTLVNVVTSLTGESALSLWISDECTTNGDWDTTIPTQWDPWTVQGFMNGVSIIDNNDTGHHPYWEIVSPAGGTAACNSFCMTNGVPAVAVEGLDCFPLPDGEYAGCCPSGDEFISCTGEITQDYYTNALSYNGTQRIPLWLVEQGFARGAASGIWVTWYDQYGHGIYCNGYDVPNTGSWQQISDTESAPSNATTASIMCRSITPGTYYFDDVSFSSGGTDLLSNSNMETGNGSGGPADWTANGGQGVTQTWATDNYHSGSHSLKTVMGDPCDVTEWWSPNVSVTGGSTYTLSGWIYPSVVAAPIPTATQSRFTAYDAIINGARGLSYFGLGELSTVYTSWPGNQLGLWTNLKEIAGEMNEVVVDSSGPYTLGNALVSGIWSFRTVTQSNNNVETLLQEFNGYKYLLTANRTNCNLGNVTITISGLPLSTCTRILGGDSGSPTMSSNSFTDTFNGYQVHVYQIY